MESNMEYTFVKDYKSDSTLRSSFNDLAIAVFGIDFEQWYQYGFWNNRYICYSFSYGGRIVANVSANLMDLVVEGKRRKAIQIGTVMTHPDHRRKGLAEKLMNVVMREYEKSAELIFLFANQDALEFYSQFAFQPVNETMFSTELNLEGLDYPPSRKLDLTCDKDLGLLKRLASERVPASGVFGVEHADGILEWHCLYGFRENLHYIQELDTLVVCKEQDGTVELYDLIYRNKPDLHRATGSILGEGICHLNFHFTPEFEGVRVFKQPFVTEEYAFLVRPDRSLLPEEFFFPHTAHA